MLSDTTAGLMYSLGCSLVHFAMFIGILVIKRPDQEAARNLDIEYN